MRCIAVLALALAPSCSVSNDRQVESPINDDEEVVFFPTFAHRCADGSSWLLSIHGWIHEPEADSKLRSAALGTLRRVLGVSKEEAATPIFQERARAFLADNERGKEVSVRLGSGSGGVFTLEESGPNGHFRGTVRLSVARASALLGGGRGDGWLDYEAIARKGDSRRFSGRVQLIEPEGLSVISDIDDTIKVTGVSSRKTLLVNTFLREFEPAPGMVELYRGWAQRGARFHYVSSSPWQLYKPLAEFLEKTKYPSGSFHLKTFRWKDSSFFSLFASAEKTKPRVIEPIFEAFPKRRFLLVGDSGEKDPEVYGAVARKFPGQVERILIRAVDGHDPGDTRFRAAFRDVPEDRWQVFRQPSEVRAFSP